MNSKKLGRPKFIVQNQRGAIFLIQRIPKKGSFKKLEGSIKYYVTNHLASFVQMTPLGEDVYKNKMRQTCEKYRKLEGKVLKIWSF